MSTVVHPTAHIVAGAGTFRVPLLRAPPALSIGQKAWQERERIDLRHKTIALLTCGCWLAYTYSVASHTPNVCDPRLRLKLQ
jgi:hypothetical protein